MSKEGPSKISRRHFLKIGGAAAVVVLVDPMGIISAEAPVQRRQIIGDYLPEFLTKNKIAGGGSEPLISLPEQEKDDRSWNKIETSLKPPETYRSAMSWSDKLGGFLLHGGWGNNNNHNETWIFKDNQWSNLEKGSAPSLHGHKMTETPLGVVMFGGVIKQPNGTYDTSDQFFLYNQDKNIWEKLSFKWESIHSSPRLQGMGMVYNPETKSVWIMGGGSGSPVQTSDSTFELFIPGASDANDWYLKGMGYLGSFNYPQVFEPLAYCVPGDSATYLYGGLGPDGQGNVLASTKSFKITNVETNIQVAYSNLPLIDYGGTLRGGYDRRKQELVLNSGRSANFFQPPYQETMEIGKDHMWYKIKSPLNPPVYDKPAVAISSTGEMIRFGGNYYDSKGQPQFSDETWLCKPISRVYLPLILDQGAK